MNKFFLGVFLFLTITTNSRGQDINKVVIDMPEDIIYGLTPDLKESLLADTNDTTKFVSTAIYPEIKRIAITDNYIALQTSEVGSTQIKLLPLINGSKIICLVQSITGTIADSKISFYTQEWIPIDQEDLFPAKNIEWFIKPEVNKTSEEYTETLEAVTMYPMKLTLASEEDAILVEFNPKSFLPREFESPLKPFFNDEPKVLKWDKTKFK